MLGARGVPMGEAAAYPDSNLRVLALSIFLHLRAKVDDVAGYAGWPAGYDQGVDIYRRWGKRALDLSLASSALVVSGPALLALAALIRLDSPGSPFFLQRRLGRQGATFRILKLRTMTARDRRVGGEVLAGNPEVTRVGAILRRLKLDELPQLLNVVRGDMSLVGPRPDIPEHLESYTPTALERLQVRPGMTGLAQIQGNIFLSWPERWEYDAEYVRRLSLETDLWIALRTLGVIVLGEQKFLRPRQRGLA